MNAFGSGPHRCAGERHAIAETDVFVGKLLALKGPRVEKQPDIAFKETVERYEMTDMIVVVK